MECTQLNEYLIWLMFGLNVIILLLLTQISKAFTWNRQLKRIVFDLAGEIARSKINGRPQDSKQPE